MRDKSNCCNKKVTAPCLFNVDDILIREAEEVTKVSICFPFTLIAVKKKTPGVDYPLFITPIFDLKVHW